MRINSKFVMPALGVGLALGVVGCSGAGLEEDVDSVQSAQEACVVATPEIVEIREEGPGPVAGGSAIFAVTVTSTSMVTPGIHDLGFTVNGRHGQVNRGSVRYILQ